MSRGLRRHAAIATMATALLMLPASPSTADPSAPRPTRILGWSEVTTRVTPGASVSDGIRVRTAGKALRRAVALLRAPAGSGQWTRIWRGRTGAGGHLRLRFTTANSGAWKYRVRVKGTPKAKTALSASRRIVVWTPQPATTPPTPLDPPLPAKEHVVYVTGDIGVCGGAADRTAALIDRNAGVIVATGDLAYPNGTEADFANCYDPHYGIFKDVTFPVPGNHEYNSGATAYFAYFGSRVGTGQQPWYAVHIGAWRFYMLNSNCAQVGGCEPDSAQYQWLLAQLSGDQPRCTAAVWHHPRWSSGVHGPTPATSALYDLLARSGTDLLLTGHEHNYERFARMDSSGQVDPSGIREFVVGTGGASLRNIPGMATGSEARLNDSHGVLRLTLGDSGFGWRFNTTEPTGMTDSGSELCS